MFVLVETAATGRVGGKNRARTAVAKMTSATSEIADSAAITIRGISMNSTTAPVPLATSATARSRTLPFIVRLASAARAVR